MLVIICLYSHKFSLENSHRKFSILNSQFSAKNTLLSTGNYRTELELKFKTVKIIGKCQFKLRFNGGHLNHCDIDDLFPLSTFLSCCLSLVIRFFITGNYLFVGFSQRADLVTKWDQSNLCTLAYFCFTCSQVQLHPNKDIQ